MLGSGDSAGAVRLWWVRHDDDRAIRFKEISGLPYGTESNPPAWDPEGRIVIAYDAGNAVLRAWRLDGDDLVPVWRRDGFAHAGHLIVYPDTRELVAQDWHDAAWLRRPLVRRAMRPAFQGLAAQSAWARRAGQVVGQRRPGGARPGHGRGQGAGRDPVRMPGVPLPGAGLQSATSTTSRSRRSPAS